MWQELDLVRVKGKAQTVAIHTPLETGATEGDAAPVAQELKQWQRALKAWRTQDWDACESHLGELRRGNAKKVLYRLYADRVASMRQSPPPQDWDGAVSFDSK